MEIRKTTTPQVTLISGNTQTQTHEPKVENKTHSNEPQVSQDWHLLEKGHKELKNLPDFDADKVAALRQSIQDGSFDLSSDAIAQAMLRQHG